jgi:DNA invertase Pin-like site-specific DNA recombinase
MIACGQQSNSVNNARSFLDGIGKNAFVANGKLAPVNDPDAGAAVDSPSYALPTNLSIALSHLDDNQLDRLLSAVISELKRRGKKLPRSVEPSEPSRKQRTKEVTPPLAQGKLNAVRAAFKAGVTPSRIAREFGISHAHVRKALESDKKN